MWLHGIFAFAADSGRTYIYPYYFHRGKVLTSRSTLVGRLLLPWLVYRKYPTGAGRSPFTLQCIHSGICGFYYTPRPHALEACGETIPTRAPDRPTAWEKSVYWSPLTAILVATAQLLTESILLLPLFGCRTRLLRAWPHAFLWARRCPPAKHPIGCWACCVQFRCKYVVSCCCLCVPFFFLSGAWDRQWRSSRSAYWPSA